MPAARVAEELRLQVVVQDLLPGRFGEGESGDTVLRGLDIELREGGIARDEA